MSTSTMDLSAVPSELKERRQWVLWRWEVLTDKKTGEIKATKVPYDVHLYKASTTNPNTWTTFDRCVAALDTALEDWAADDLVQTPSGGGVGYVFSPDDLYCGLDLDHVRDPLTRIVAPWAAHLIRLFASYTELSPSMTGAHIITKATLPGKGFEKSGFFGLYDRGRYFTMTGQLLSTPAPIRECQPLVEQLYTVRHVLIGALQRYGERFSHLFAGDWQTPRTAQGLPYASQSEADLAFCTMATQANAGAEHIDILMRMSGLYRDKWNREDYRSETTRKAQASGEGYQRRNGHSPGPEPSTPPSWQDCLLRTKSGEVKEAFSNLVLTLEHLEPWCTEAWYDAVRELPMVGTAALHDQEVAAAALAIGQRYGVAIHNLKLVQSALVYVCRQKPRDVLQEWLKALPPWDGKERLPFWLSDLAGAPQTEYGMAVSRLLPVSMVARAMDPGCQYRNVVIFEGAEDIGKSKLVKALASPEWYREVSHGLEGKEAHMIIMGAWVAELAELSSLSKTEEARLKSFITMQSDDYIPKFSNLPVSRKRRTVFVGTVNPEGDGAYLRGQTGNTRYLPIPVSDVQIDGVLAAREQLFAEALVYYADHPNDWWQLTTEAATEARDEREKRRQVSPYQDSLAEWLDGKDKTTWEEIARSYLLLDAKEKWKDRALQMEIARALRALGWRSKVEKAGDRSIRVWVLATGKTHSAGVEV